MRTPWLAGVALSVVIGAGAFAADAPPSRRSATFSPVYVPFFAWNGVYGGVFAGYGFGQSNWTSTTGLTTGDFNVDGGVAGGTLGYNMQFNTLVLGVEADVGWSGIKGTSTSAVCASGCETKNTWLGTARARVGYAFDRFLPFISGGAAFGNLTISDGAAEASTTKIGYALGGGLEYAFSPSWSAKIDYHYVDLGKATCGAGCTAGAAFETKFDTHLVRGGVNFKF